MIAAQDPVPAGNTISDCAAKSAPAETMLATVEEAIE
jgi:hypothetical protein